MGLIPHRERCQGENAITWAKGVAEKNLDLDALERIARHAAPFENAYAFNGMIPVSDENNDKKNDFPDEADRFPSMDGRSARIGFVRDNAFWFYYPENLDQLKKLGAVLVEVDSLADKTLPPLDALYIGGGFPETQAEALANNLGFRESLKRQVQAGLPVYAECGGLMYLGESLLVNETAYPMAGILPLKCVLEKKPQGHGYTILETSRPNPYYPVGEILKGHEFHYSRPLITNAKGIETAFQVKRGHGLDGRRDGLYKKNLLATYTHLHASGNSLWGKSFFKKAIEFKRQNTIFFNFKQ